MSGDGVATAPEPLLEARHVMKRFPIGGLFSRRQVHAVEDASFSIRAAQVVSVVGESGSGKSTTARLIARLTPPTGGEIRFKGADIVRAEPHGASLAYRSSVQMVFQDPFASLNPVHTVGHHLARPLSIHRRAGSGRELRSRINELLTIVGLNPAAEFAGKYPHQLSGGQRQRVAFARALAVEPELVLADEPVSMLDVSIRMGLLNLMDQLREERRIAYLYITHDLASARYIGDETVVMYAGYMVEGGESDELMRHAVHPYTQLLLSAVPDPRAGLRPRRLEGRSGVPSRIDPGPGCPFAGRCPHTMAVCRETMPGVERLDGKHWVRCHLHGPGT